MSKAIKIKADIMWAFLDKVNDMSGKYQVDLCNLSPAAVGALEDMGLSVNSKEGKGFFITCKSTNPIRAYDEAGKEITGVNVGNGSEGIAVISTYEWQFKNKTGVSPSLRKLTITELEVYSEDGDEDALEVEEDVL